MEENKKGIAGAPRQNNRTGEIGRTFNSTRQNAQNIARRRDSDALSNTSSHMISRCLDRVTPPLCSTRTPAISPKCPEIPLPPNVSRMYLDILDNRVGSRTFFCSVRQYQNISTRLDRRYCLRCQCLYGRLGVPLFPPPPGK